MAKTFPVVYHSLEQVIHTLRTSEVAKTTEVHQLLKICASSAYSSLLDPITFELKYRPLSVIKPKMPFIVIEGLDGSGKTKVSQGLINLEPSLERYSTPPENIKFLKEFFDEQRESIRRAYYSLGNYLMAQEITNTKGLKAIIMDRYWHSTAAYAVAQKSTVPSSDSNSNLPENWFEWPTDLLKPQLVIFLIVSEKVRKYRHAFRNTTNTKEEQALATNIAFRDSLISSYRKIEGVNFLEIDADPEIEDIIKNVHDILIKKFPLLHKSST